MQRELQEAWAANCVLDEAQATLRGNRGRTGEIGKEGHVVIWSVEIRMIENIERIGFKPELVALLDHERLGQAHVEAHLEWASKTVPACSSKQGFKVIAPAGVAGRHPVGPWSHELGQEISGIKLTNFGRKSLTIRARMCCLRGRDARCQRHNWVPNIVAGAVVQTRHRPRKVINAVRLTALRDGLAANRPAIGQVAQWPALHGLRNRIAVVDQKNVGLIEIRAGVVGSWGERIVSGEKES